MKSPIWIIGASEGIGAALALRLSREGGPLILSARSEGRLSQLAESLNCPTHCIPMDVTDLPSIKAAWENASPLAPTTIIYCAGDYTPMGSESIQIEKAQRMVEVNLLGAMKVLSFCLPPLIQNNQGHIVLIGSIAGYRGLPNSFGYGASKAGLIHLAENLKSDLGKTNLKIQVINPGFVKTRLTNMNSFTMPSIQTPEQAAEEIFKAMNSNAFESRFPFVFGNLLKFIGSLPSFLFFPLMNLIKTKKD